MKHCFFVYLILLVSCSKIDYRTPLVEQEIDNTQNNNTPSIEKKEPMLSHNNEQEEFTVIEMDKPTIFIMTGGNIEILMEYDDRHEIRDYGVFEGSYFYVDLETSDYVIFGKMSFSGGGTLKRQNSIVYRKKDRRFFDFHADGGNGSLLYIINYNTRTFDFFEIADNGTKIDIASVPMPNDGYSWTAINDKIIVNNIVRYEKKEIYRLDGINIEKLPGYSSFQNLTIFGRSSIASYIEDLYGSRDRIVINLSNLKETHISRRAGFSGKTNESLFFLDVDRLGRYDIQTGVYSLMEGIIADENTKIGDSFRLSDFFIQGYNEFSLNIIYYFKNNQFLYNSNQKICMYDFDSDMLYILFDYNIYPDSDRMSYLYLINDCYFYSINYGMSDFVSLDEKRILYRFIMKWIDPAGTINDISYMRYYETREGDIIIYPVFGSNFKD